MGGEAEGTGCGHDFRYVWSSSTRVQVPAALAPDSNNGNIVCPDGQKVVVLGKSILSNVRKALKICTEYHFDNISKLFPLDKKTTLDNLAYI